MTQWIPIRLLALSLGLWVALAPAIIAMPAAAMGSQMSMSGDAAVDCNDCPDMPRSNMDGAFCALVCCGPAFLAFVPESVKLAAIRIKLHWFRVDPLFLGRSLRPDPAPPKSFLS
jgi:hypothetical protein